MKTLQKCLRKRLTKEEFVEKFYNKSKSSGSKSVLIAVLRAFDNFSSQIYGETSEKLLEKLRGDMGDALVDGWMFGDYHYGIPDVKVMLKLGFTPQSWTRYRPLLIRYCQCYDLIKTESRDGVTIEIIRLAIRFHKKSKLWHGKRNALMLDDVEQATWRKMTDEELEKYNPYWLPEEEFFL